MKKQLLLFAILVVSLTCFACSKAPTASVSPSVQPSEEQSVEKSVEQSVVPSVTPTRPYSELFFSRPNDTNLEFWITESVAGKSFSNYETAKEEEFGIAWYCGTGYHADMTEKVLYGITGYPDYADGASITSIDITDPQATVYGLTLNSSKEDFTTKMEQLGFTVTQKERKISATKGSLTVSFYQGERIYLWVEVTNHTGIVF